MQNRSWRRWIIFGLACGLLVASLGVARAAGEAVYTVDWWTADGGGGEAKGGDFTLSGTIGQAEAGRLNEDIYTLVGGFWGTLQEAWKEVFLPIIMR
jgi:hypothetical protein